MRGCCERDSLLICGESCGRVLNVTSRRGPNPSPWLRCADPPRSSFLLFVRSSTSPPPPFPTLTGFETVTSLSPYPCVLVPVTFSLLCWCLFPWCPSLLRCRCHWNHLDPPPLLPPNPVPQLPPPFLVSPSKLKRTPNTAVYPL